MPVGETYQDSLGAKQLQIPPLTLGLHSGSVGMETIIGRFYGEILVLNKEIYVGI